MFQLLNRFAWCLSITLGLALAIYIDNDLFIGGILLGLILKYMFLSESFITSRLEFFASNLEKRLGENISTRVVREPLIVEEEKQVSQPLTQTEEIKTEAIDLELLEDTQDIKEYIANFSQPVTQQETRKQETISEQKSIQEEFIPEEPSKVALYIKSFFAENLLAKIGSILVFLGVVFLMSLIWNQIPGVGKIIIGFVIGFTTYITGVILDKKGLSGEARTLLGTGILINFLVILAGKHIIGDNFSDSNVLSTGVTFFFLILNTVLGVVTSMVYKSRTILLFSFIFAYINPFLTGGSGDNPYTLVGYSMIVSLGALFIGTKQNDNILKYSAFILGNILFLVAPFGTEIGWITKIVASSILGFLTIINFSQTSKQHIPGIFITNYVFIIALLIAGSDASILQGGISFITYMISILFFFGIGVWLFLKKTILSASMLFIFPILIVLGLIFSGSVGFITPTLGIIVLAYLIGFNFLESILAPSMKYIFFGILGIFIFLVNSFLSFNVVTLDFPSFLTVIIVSFVFLFTSYYLSRKDTLEFLYTIGTIGGILTLVPVLVVTNKMNFINSDVKEILVQSNTTIYISVVAIIIFAFSNWILPFINKNLTKQGANVKNLLFGSIFGILFIGFQLFNYGSTYFPGITLGLSFGGLAIVYFILSYLMMNKLGVENVKSEVSSKNTIFSYLFISISLFSLAISLVFANNPEIISTVWLFEATILFYFYSKTQETKVFGLGMVLFIIGIFQLFDLNVSSKEFLFLIPFTIIFLSLVFNLKFLESIKSGAGRVFHDIFHILGIGVLAGLLIDIIPNTGHGWSVLGISLFILVLGFIYSKFSSKILKVFFIVSLSGFMLYQVSGLRGTLSMIDYDKIGYLRMLQYIGYFIIAGTVLVWNKFNLAKIFTQVVNGLFIIFTLVIISQFVLDIFNTTFAVTIFWAVISSILLFYGISADKIKLRTVGLYLLTLVLGKIFIYDIWYGLDDAVTRVVALIVIGVLLIVISTRYTRKYGNNLSGEFNFDNLVDKTEKTEETETETESEVEVESKSESNNIQNASTADNGNSVINTKIKDIDVSDIDSVKFYPNGSPAFTSKAKNLKKIVKLIGINKDISEVAPNELLETYDYVIKNYKSELTKRDFTMLTGAIKDFIEKGGKVEIKK